ncbi:hypothetical protein QTP88_000873 [Uroleucon formosanum]
MITDQPAAPIINQPARPSVIQFAPRIEGQAYIQIAPQIVVPDIAAGGSNTAFNDITVMNKTLDLEDTEATYNIPNVENSSENRAFKTAAVELFRESDILTLVEELFTKLLTEEEAYTGRGSGFTLGKIDGLLLGVYKYTPMSGSSYISLPDSIDRKRGTINPQNNDEQCFKWAILAKHVTEQTKCRIGENYRKHEGKYIFDGISFPTPLSDIKIFEKNNPFVSINIFGIEKHFQPPKKVPTYEFISFSKYVSHTFTVRFIDTCRFMASKLSTLAKNLLTPDFSKFRETGKHFATSDMDLVTRKGVYPYEYTDEWSKLDENALPNKAEFYSILTESAIKDEEYEHAMKVWDHFECKTIGEYSDLYLKIDVLLLADIFENFRDVCMKTYNIDPAYYYTAPGFSFDAILKYTAIKLELLSEYEMLLMFEDGIRGGHTQASMRYAKSNNEKTLDYNQANPKSWLVYQDYNNLYGWAMSQYMPYGDFKWVKPSLDGLNDLTEDSPIGRVYEVDIVYPKKLHDRHNDLPFLPQNSIPPGSKVHKLMATFEPKKNYIVHYRNLQQALNNGLIVEKIHRVIQFKQSPWLAKYIELNTNMRKKAKNEFERDFFKLMKNAVFGIEDEPRDDDEWPDYELDAGGREWDESEKDLMRLLLREMSK